jgi:hypothetical protein
VIGKKKLTSTVGEPLLEASELIALGLAGRCKYVCVRALLMKIMIDGHDMLTSRVHMHVLIT